MNEIPGVTDPKCESADPASTGPELPVDSEFNLLDFYMDLAEEFLMKDPDSDASLVGRVDSEQRLTIKLVP